MADRFNVSYEIGGPVRANEIPNLVKAIQDTGLSLNYGADDGSEPLTQEVRRCVAEGKPLIVSAIEIAWGHTDHLDQFCRSKKLAFRKAVEGKYDYNGEILWWQPGMRKVESWQDTDKDAQRVMISIEKLEKAVKDGRTLIQVIEDLRLVAPTPPALQILS